MKNLKTIMAIGLIVPFLISCSGKGNPSGPQLDDKTDLSIQTDGGSGTHALLSYSYVYVDASDLKDIQHEIIPVREVSSHFNILNFLEKSPCTDCFTVTGINPSGSGTLLVDVEISGPFPNPTFTGFDLRGIAMFNGNHPFPEAGLKFGDRYFGDGEVVNADGYTTLYKGSTAGSGPGGLQGYLKGKFATLLVPDGDINGYKRFITNDPANTRNAFYAGDAITQTYEIDMPNSQFIFGYAVDVSWATPISTPVDDPMTDFGPDANCPEPWRIRVLSTGIGPFDPTHLTIDVYDYQGMASHAAPVLECPEIFDGTKTAALVSEETGYTRYEISIGNENSVVDGIYRCLVSVEDNDNNPGSTPWLDLTAYQVVDIKVAEGFDISEVTPESLNGYTMKYLVNGNYLFIASNLNGIQIYDISNLSNIVWHMNLLTEYDGIHSMAINGGYLYAAAYGDDLIIFDIDPLESSYVVYEGDYNGSASSIANNGSIIYLTCATFPDGELNIIDASDPAAPVVLNTITFTGYPYDLKYDNGYIYQATSDEGIKIFDVDPPGSASIVATVPTPGPAVALDLIGNYLYAGCRWEGLQIIDIDPPETSSIIKAVSTNYANDVSVLNGYAYIADDSQGIKIIDVEPPGAASVVNTLSPNWWTNVTLAVGNTLFAGCSGGTLAIDITNPLVTANLDSFFYPAWSYGVDVKDGRVVVGNMDAGILILDASNPEAARVDKRFSVLGALDVSIVGDYAYVLCYSGLRIIDMSTPGSENVINSIDFNNSPTDLYVDSGYAFVAGGYFDLVILDVDPPESASVVANVSTTLEAQCVIAKDGYAYVGAGYYPDYSFNVVDIDPIGSASEVLTFPIAQFPMDLETIGNYIYGAIGYEGLILIDIADPTTASIIDTFDISGHGAQALRIYGNYLYIASYQTSILDVTNPLAPVELNYASFSGGNANALAIEGQYGYVAVYPGGVRVLKLW